MEIPCRSAPSAEGSWPGFIGLVLGFSGCEARVWGSSVNVADGLPREAIGRCYWIVHNAARASQPSTASCQCSSLRTRTDLIDHAATIVQGLCPHGFCEANCCEKLRHQPHVRLGGSSQCEEPLYRGRAGRCRNRRAILPRAATAQGSAYGITNSPFPTPHTAC